MWFLLFSLLLLQYYYFPEIIFVAVLSEIKNFVETLWAGRLPGSKWCGLGHSAETYDELGYFTKSDECCRAHDNCNDTISKESGPQHGFSVTAITKLNCYCDLEFLDCLQHRTDTMGFLLSVFYFNIVGGQCFKYDYPATCVQQEGLFGTYWNRCIKYSYNKTLPKEWGLFDIPLVMPHPLIW